MYFLSSEILKQVIYYFSFIIVIIFGSYCVMFFDMQKHETTMNDNEVFNNFLQSSSSSSGKRRCYKDGRNNFSLVFEATVCYRRRGHISRQNEWVSDGNNRIPILIQFLPDVHCVTSSLFWSTIEDDNKFPDGAWKNSFFLKKYLIRCDRRIMKNLKENFFLWRGVFYRVNQRIMPSTSEDAFYLVLAVTLQKMINIEIIL